jgi:hypothetical protein
VRNLLCANQPIIRRGQDVHCIVVWREFAGKLRTK